MLSINYLLNEIIEGLGLTPVSEPVIWTRVDGIGVSSCIPGEILECGKHCAKVEVDLGVGRVWLKLRCRYVGRVINQKHDILFFTHDPGEEWSWPDDKRPFAGIYSGSFHGLIDPCAPSIVDQFMSRVFG
jgi:hypothetical protein